MIIKIVSHSEVLSLFTLNFYSVLYHNLEVWQIPSLKPVLKQMLLSASSKHLKHAQRNLNPMESFVSIHKSCNRALLSQIINYKHAVLLYKLHNQHLPKTDWVELNFNKIFHIMPSAL